MKHSPVAPLVSHGALFANKLTATITAVLSQTHDAGRVEEVITPTRFTLFHAAEEQR